MTEASQTPERVVTALQAAQLCKSGEWITDLTAIDIAFSAVNEARRPRAEEPDGWRAVVIRHGEDFASAIMQATRERLSAQFEHAAVFDDFDDSMVSAVRVGATAVYRVQATAVAASLKGIDIVCGVLGSLAVPALWVRTGKRFVELIRIFSEGYRKAEGPAEEKVFIAVVDLLEQHAIVDYDALARRDFQQAYGSISPTTDQVVDTLRAEMSEADIKLALQSMEARGVLRKRSGRWSIPF